MATTNPTHRTAADNLTARSIDAVCQMRNQSAALEELRVWMTLHLDESVLATATGVLSNARDLLDNEADVLRAAAHHCEDVFTS